MANERLVQGAFQPYYAGSSRATPLDVDLLLGPQKIYIGKVTVNGIGTDLRQRMLKALNDPPKAWFKAACAADDFKTYVPLNKITRVSSVDVTIPKDVNPAVSRLVETLRMNVSGGIVIGESLVMLLYPVGMEAWNFMETGPARANREAELRVQLLAAKEGSLGWTGHEEEGSSLAIATLSPKHYLQAILRHLYNVRYRDLLPTRGRDTQLAGTFFLIVPPSKAAELKLYAEFLRLSGARSISTSMQDGAWDKFRTQHEHGTLLIHPSFTAIHRIPNFVSLLRKGFIVYKFGFEENADNTHDDETMSRAAYGSFVCSRLFSHGCVILLTDSLIIENPVAADRIIRWFAEKYKQRAPNTWKLVGRPDFKDWVLAVANERAEKDGLRSELFKARYQIWLTLDELLPAHLTTHVTLDDNPNHISTIPTEDAPVFWELHLPGYSPLIQSTHPTSTSSSLPNPTAMNQSLSSTSTIPPPPAASTTTTAAAANNNKGSILEECHDRELAQWFCGWALTKTDQYRRFVIVHPEPRRSSSVSISGAAAAAATLVASAAASSGGGGGGGGAAAAAAAAAGGSGNGDPGSGSKGGSKAATTPTHEELSFSQAVDVVTPERFFTAYT